MFQKLTISFNHPTAFLTKLVRSLGCNFWATDELSSYWLGFCGAFVFNFFRFFLLGMGDMNIETVLDWTSGCPVSLLHKMGFAVSSAWIAQGFIQSALENLRGLELLHRSEQYVLLLDRVQTAEGFNWLTVVEFFPKYKSFFISLVLFSQINSLFICIVWL